MEIIFMAENEIGQQETITIPVVQGIEAISCETKDEEFETANGKTLNLIGGKGLRSFSFSSFFPSKKYCFVSWFKFKNPKEYIRFFEKYRDLRVPVRVIVIDKYQVVLNMLCRYNFIYQIRDRAGDIPYTLDIKEYILPATGSDSGV
ncbi:MAG: phage portal protein [Fusobacterium necrophorum]|nr:phage portal protein [Fusobacterium necrophorum]